MDDKKVLLNGKTIVLGQKEYVTAGGQGQIFKKDGLIYKVYISAMDSAMEKKLKFMACLKKDNIVAPKDVLYSPSGEPVGYTMRYVDNASALALLFTKNFKQRNGISQDNLDKIYVNMAETFRYIHDRQVIVVDANELNFLVSNADWETPYFLDVDSYSNKDFPPQAIMASAQDFRRSDFCRETDWYSFSVLMFQLYTGIHPYMGYHPKYNFFVDSMGNQQKKDDIATRRKNLVSVYDPQVKYPPFVKLDKVPGSLAQWFQAMFVDGQYLPPPDQVTAIVMAPQTVKSYSSGMSETLMKDYGSDVLSVRFVDGTLLVSVASKYFVGNFQFDKVYQREMPVLFDDHGELTVIHVTKDSTGIKYSWRGKETPLGIKDLGKMAVIKNRLFAVVESQLVEFEMSSYTKQLTSKAVWNVTPNAVKFFPGVVYCDTYGTATVYIPEVKDAVKAMYVVTIPELNGRQVIDMMYENLTMIAVSKFNGKYERTLVKFDKAFLRHETLQEECQLQEINAAVLANGMCLSYDGSTLELSKAGSTVRKLCAIDTEMSFAHSGNEVLGVKGSEIYSLHLS